MSYWMFETRPDRGPGTREGIIKADIKGCFTSTSGPSRAGRGLGLNSFINPLMSGPRGEYPERSMKKISFKRKLVIDKQNIKHSQLFQKHLCVVRLDIHLWRQETVSGSGLAGDKFPSLFLSGVRPRSAECRPIRGPDTPDIDQ